MEEIKSHPWLNADCASQGDVNLHYQTLKNTCNMNNEDRDKATAEYLNSGQVCRSHGGDSEVVECPEDHKTLWTEQTENGESKEFAGESMGGFYTKQMPVNVFSYMWCLINDDHEEPVVSDKSMKMKFNLKQEKKTVKVEADGDFSEGEEEIPEQEASGSVNIRSCEHIDEDTFYVDFVNKSGNKMLFAKFVKEISKSMELWKDTKKEE